MSLTNPPRALLTDVFGTVVDWRTSVTKHLIETTRAILSDPSLSISSQTRLAADSVSWPEFAQQWRTSYYNFTRSYDPARSGPFVSVDDFFRDSLSQLLQEHGLTELFSKTQTQQMARIWHSLTPWPDSSRGLGQLNSRFATCTLSNGNTGLLQDLARHGSLPYTHLLSAEDFGAYKPHARVYDGAAEKLGLPASQCAMVAAHLNDLEAARGRGYQTIYIERQQEEQWDGLRVEAARRWVDMWIQEDQGGFEELARRFNCIAGSVSEDAARAGTYHEDPSIVDNTSKTDE